MPKNPTLFRSAFATYAVQRQVGVGGSGVVYEVRDEDLQQFALKILHPNVDRRKLKRFKNEASFCQKSLHPNIVQILDYGFAEAEKETPPFYVMPFYTATLRDLIKGGITPSDVLPIFDQLLSGVEAAHLSNVVHRDLKPENVLFDRTLGRLVVADFGIASFSQEELYTAVETRNSERLANFCYAAPEQRERGREITARADVFALGLMLNEMFTGMIPNGTNFKRIGAVSGSHAYLDGLVDQMLDQEPTKRLDSIGQIKRELFARGNEFIALQKLNQMKTEVIPESQLDDPLIQHPIEIRETDFRLGEVSGSGVLIFFLSQRPNQNWIEAFANQVNYRCYSGHEPRRFAFGQDSMQIYFDRGIDPKGLASFAKTYVENANSGYVRSAQAAHDRQIRENRRIRQQEIAAEEERLRILKAIRS